MNDMELVKWARVCSGAEGRCDDCPFDGAGVSAAHSCVARLLRALAARVEVLGDRCARYAEEIAVGQEVKRDE